MRDEKLNVLWWVDIPAGFIHRFDVAPGRNSGVEFGEPVGCLAEREQGGLVLAAKSGFRLLDPATGSREHMADPESHLPDNRFNDGTADFRGRFWAGTMKDGKPAERRGAFYRLDADLKVTCWRDGFYTTNGLAFSPDGRRMYFSDSNSDVRTIRSSECDPGTGVPGKPEVYFDTGPVAGRLDGRTVDADGCHWQASVGGWQLYRISPD